MPKCILEGWEGVELPTATIKSIEKARTQARLISERFADQSDFNSLGDVVAALVHELDLAKRLREIERIEQCSKLQDPNHIVIHVGS